MLCDSYFIHFTSILQQNCHVMINFKHFQRLFELLNLFYVNFSTVKFQYVTIILFVLSYTKEGTYLPILFMKFTNSYISLKKFNIYKLNVLHTCV